MIKGKREDNLFFMNHGFSIVEIVVALGVFAVLIPSLFAFSFQGLNILSRSSYYNQTLSFLNEGEEAVRAIAKNNWSSLSFAQSAIATSSGGWVLVGEGSTESFGNFSRTIYFSHVYRDDNNNIVASNHPQASEDSFSIYADVHVAWQASGQRAINLNRKILLTNYFANPIP